MASTDTSTRSLWRTVSFAAPLALVLAACNGAEEEGSIEGDAIASIPAPDGSSWAETVTVSESDGYIVGNPDAPLKLVEYASHTCGGCAAFSAQAKDKLISDYIASGVVSFEQRNLVRDPIDLTIATLVRCGAKENVQPLSDQAWTVLNDTFANVQQNNAAYEAASAQPLEQRFVTIAEAAGLIDFFAARGLSSDQARTCLADKAKVETIADNSSTQADELNINATPTFILNGRTLDVTSWGELEPILQRAGAR
ncbi:thioredoxin domain-containing protein [Erythrobacter sp. YT30]|uniref:thioredoxin domain-containing protein n=1 Tax=Erythrobacter sp. YT30 TaxID=1735012 RepID=UPI00076C67D8|nr:thioredoxin domain-containing protein [Erythrobacter sp. YT30]KWV93388.1 protein-disulfide isomerase [Erythrobacter sp. YT30]